MGKYPVYAIVTLVFIGIVKLLQVIFFDVGQYNKNKKTSFAKAKDKVETPIKEKETKFNPSDTASQVATEVPPPVLGKTENDSTDEIQATETGAFESTRAESKSSTSYKGLTNLKNIYLASKIANLSSGQLREDIVIRYYRHDLDGDKVYSLRELGYYIHEKEATGTVGLGSNILYYGHEVNIEDIQIVAYTLLEKGLLIKSIEPTQHEWKFNSIEIGTDQNVIDARTLTAADVSAFKK